MSSGLTPAESSVFFDASIAKSKGLVLESTNLRSLIPTRVSIQLCGMPNLDSGLISYIKLTEETISYGKLTSTLHILLFPFITILTSTLVLQLCLITNILINIDNVRI